MPELPKVVEDSVFVAEVAKKAVVVRALGVANRCEGGLNLGELQEGIKAIGDSFSGSFLGPGAEFVRMGWSHVLVEQGFVEVDG